MLRLGHDFLGKIRSPCRQLSSGGPANNSTDPLCPTPPPAHPSPPYPIPTLNFPSKTGTQCICGAGIYAHALPEQRHIHPSRQLLSVLSHTHTITPPPPHPSQPPPLDRTSDDPTPGARSARAARCSAADASTPRHSAAADATPHFSSAWACPRRSQHRPHSSRSRRCAAAECAERRAHATVRAGRPGRAVAVP